MTSYRERGHQYSICCIALFVASLVVMLLVGAGVAYASPSTKHKFEIEPGSFHFVPSTFQAGEHADWTTTFNFRHNGNEETYNDLRDTVVNLPAGFMASNTAVPTCSAAQLVNQTSVKGGPGGCPPASQVGTINLDLNLGSPEGPAYVTFPVFNMEPTSYGVTAELGFNVIVITQMLNVNVRPGDSGLTVTAPETKDYGEPHNISVTVWGVPGSPEHDAQRGEECFPHNLESTTVTCEGGGEKLTGSGKPFLANPTNCSTFEASMRADSWEEPGKWSSETAKTGPITGCERVPFDPSITMQPTTDSAESPSGLNLLMEVPQSWQYSNSFATSTLKDTKVTLPVGYTVNPSAGNGLVGCTPAQYEAETAFSPPGAGCPPESKLGKVTIETPLLAETIKGDVYIAQPYDNPFPEPPAHPNGSLLALYVVAKDPERGIVIKAPGKVEPNETTGQLVTTFEKTPQQPFNKLTFEFKQGQTSPLVSPPVCGTYTVDAELTPWSSLTLPGETPVEPRLLNDGFQIEHGIGGGACPAGGVPPFKPQVISGTQDNAAGNYTPFYLRILREDGEQELTKFTTILPPGLTANLTGIPFCPDSAIQHAREVTGQQEIEAPSCPAASEIGHTLVGAGVGSVLAWTPGKIYLAGPYHGSALSIVSITSAKVGPFDLGTVVIRFALKINPITGQAEIDGSGSDPIPHIIDGIVVHVRDIHVYIDRSKFMIDPTSCDRLEITDAITGAGADPANPADQQAVSVSTPFQAADCSSLGFKLSFKVSTSGKTSRRLGASLHVRLTYPNAPQGTQANIHSVKVELPKQLPSNLKAIQNACPHQIFEADPASCSSISRVGFAKAITPILPVPLEGPAYFVSYGGAKFPELVVVLQGYGITIDLHGETFINEHTNITSSTFRTVPDQPVTSFELTLPQGPFSALAAPGGLCNITKTVLVKKKRTVKIHGHTRKVTRKVRKTVPAGLVMPTVFTAQNGAVIKQNTQISVTGCPRHKAKKATRPAHRQRRR